MTVKNDLRSFIVAEMAPDMRPEDLTDDYQLIENDVVNSLGIFELVQMIEEKFGVEVDDEELVLENFASISTIAALVGDKEA